MSLFQKNTTKDYIKRKVVWWWKESNRNKTAKKI